MEDLPLTYEQLIQVIDQSYEGFLLSDVQGRIIYANKAVEDISGLKITEIVGKTPKEMEEEGMIVNQSMKILKKDPLTISQKLITGREVFITSKPIYSHEGSLICFVANYRNLTTLNELQSEHRKQLDLNYSELQQLRSEVLKTDDLISVGHTMKLLKEKIFKMAKTEAIVLIYGESGVGKEVVSKQIHKFSPRHNHPFIQINCGAIPENLIEAELFGYEKGAFTGAQTAKPGLFEVADGGTILLDEIGEMPLQLQVKLLRVIQERELTRLGGTKSKELNVRFLAATNKDLKSLVEQGKFREDLYYRLNVISITIPPLRERREDIMSLSQYFLNKYNAKYNSTKSFSIKTKELLEQYVWPGNVRQLANAVERLVIMGEEGEITPSALPDEFKNIYSISKEEIIPLKILREETEKQMIKKALAKYRTIREAARQLEIDHSTLIKKMKKLDI